MQSLYSDVSSTNRNYHEHIVKKNVLNIGDTIVDNKVREDQRDNQ